MEAVSSQQQQRKLAQRQEDVYPRVVMNVLPFQRAWQKAKNFQSPWLSEKVWILVGVVTNVRIDSVSIAADPSPSLSCEGLDS